MNTFILLLISMIFSSLAMNGFDVSSKVGSLPSSFWSCMLSSGYDFSTIRSFSNNGKVDTEMTTNILNAYKAGLSPIELYHYPDTQIPADIQIQRVLNELRKTDTLKYITKYWIDVEKDVTWTHMTTQGNFNFIKLLINAFTEQSIGLIPIGIYTRETDWKIVTSGLSLNIGLPLWWIRPGSTDYSNFEPFASWSSPRRVQYVIDKAICGGKADLSWQIADCTVSHCEQYSTCMSCTSNNCGWCSDSQKCISTYDNGNSNGLPCDNSQCTCLRWTSGGIYAPASCPAMGTHCSKYLSCYNCTIQLGCGWCTTTSSCIPGYDHGNSNGYQCNGDCEGCYHWGEKGKIPSNTICPPPNGHCSQYRACYECVSQPGCGWCTTTSSCVPGTDNGNSYGFQCDGNCDGCFRWGENGIIPASKVCPAPHTYCSGYSTCASCTTQMGCGFCNATGFCLPGTDHGNSYGFQCDGSCSDKFYWSEHGQVYPGCPA